MATVTTTQLKQIIDTALEDSDLTAHINIANNLVTQVIGSSSGLDSDTLENIELYLAAHIIAIGKERQALHEKVGPSSVIYQGKFGEGLKSTTYGQMVLTLDSTGKLANVGKQRAKIRAINQVNC